MTADDLDLEGELRIGDPEAARDALLEAGVSTRTLVTSIGLCGCFTSAPIATYSAGTYQPAEAGLPAIILPVLDDDFEVADLLAFYVQAPGRWWRRLGLAPILGVRQLHDAAQASAPLVLRETPLSWLQAGCAGAVILDWRTFTLALVVIDRIVAETPALARRLREAFARTAPEIRTLDTRPRHAA